MTVKNETGRDELAARKLLAGETRNTLDEVVGHSLGRTGKVAHAIKAGLVALRDDAVLAPGHREALEAFAWRVSESTPSANGGWIGLRCVRWRDAVHALLGTLRPTPPSPLQALFANLAAALTPQQAEQLARPLSEQQRDLFEQAVNLTRRDEVNAGPKYLQPVTRLTLPPVVGEAKVSDGYFCDRADSRYFFADIDGIVVHIKENLDTTAHFTPAGEVFFAYRVDGRLHEGRADDVSDARRRIPEHVRAVVGPKDVPTIGTWIPIRIPEEVMPCPECDAVPGAPCVDDRGPLVDSPFALIVGAPWQPEPHEETMELADCCCQRRAMYRDTFHATTAAPNRR